MIWPLVTGVGNTGAVICSSKPLQALQHSSKPQQASKKASKVKLQILDIDCCISDCRTANLFEFSNIPQRTTAAAAEHLQKRYHRSFSFKNRQVVHSRVIYDRVRNKKNNFEITPFLNYEQGTLRAGNSKSNENKTKKFLFSFSFDVLNFRALDFPHSICRKEAVM